MELRYVGKGGSLGFRDATGAKFNIPPGGVFEVDDALGAVLMAGDPLHVRPADEEPVVEDLDIPEADLSEVETGGEKDAILARFEGEPTVIEEGVVVSAPVGSGAAEVLGGDEDDDDSDESAGPSSLPDSSAASDAGGEVDGSASSGAISTSDLPSGAKIGGKRRG